MANYISELKGFLSYKEDVDPQKRLEDLFEISELGCNGVLEIVPRGICQRLECINHSELSKLPNGLPPIFPSNLELDLEEYLTHPEKLPIHNFYESQRFWPRKQNPGSLYNASFSPVQTTLKVQRNPKTGELLGYQEVDVLNADCTSKNSTSLQRLPDPQLSEVKGNPTNIPFRPGGLDEPSTINQVKEETSSLDFENDLLCIPSGFTHKITFTNAENDGSLGETTKDRKDVINIGDILAEGVDLGNELEDEEEGNSTDDQQLKDEVDSSIKDINQNTSSLKKSDSLEKLLVQNKHPENEKENKSDFVAEEEEIQDWAVMVNVKDPVKDFDSKVPVMAKSFGFPLDTFQKQAVIHLENKECVFVAAHTSAGKTVVAEYAIALASKHMTKTIYTSPIKALSNQKFRDFKDKFESVGLITGDVQINPEASCLVMTTEILRSMLYRGSKVIRDTEWVIFDEVHYVNDVERGVVWEEVLIMLPDHVSIIMLSATVPNTKEFAGWVGRIKKKKIYVISTTKRPVPLEHFLYTGNSTKTSNELFKIVDKVGKFLTNGYKLAAEAKNQRSKKSKDTYGPKGTRSKVSPNEDQNVWNSIVKMLEKVKPPSTNNQLPVVGFTFSRTRCDENADRLSRLDLTTNKEKHEIHIFIQKCVSRLKDQDGQLPQVKRMQELLKRGLAVHHSGILPILKELLFATETFAMGVNMPARTVVFDSIRKHDGTKFRDLLPGEYVQMAGRAGRRGLDDTGTVIILCKADVPDMSDLQKMMLGKPTFLESRFRLTYSMILNLLRSDDLSVEDMMKRSFAEFHLLKNAPQRKKMIKKLEEQLNSLVKLGCHKCKGDIKNYYDTCKELMELKKLVQFRTISSMNGQKTLSCGRVIILNNKEYGSRFGIILNSKKPYPSDSPIRARKTYSVLIICDATELVWTDSKKALPNSEDIENIVQPYVKDTKVFCPDRPCCHKVIELIESDIAVITKEEMKVKSEAIINDYNKRQQIRFRNDPPGESITSAAEKLLRLSEANPQGLPMLDLTIKDEPFVEKLTRQKMLESSLEYFQCVGCLCFEEHFMKYREERALCDQLSILRNESSPEILTLIPEYRSRNNVLVHLGYLNENNVVQMKGRVACEISNHEIVISSLLMERFFNEFDPAEIVALLSCFVFEQRKCSEPKLTENLCRGKEIILQAAEKIAQTEIDCGMDTSIQEFKEQFKFGLVEVVFEWARGMPFYQITGLTDVQEGIIVRCIQRLNELCQDVKNAARQIGVAEVQNKMEEGSSLLKRDIVFAASLYTQ